MTEQVVKETFDCWAVLELFGHVRLAGHVTEATIGGCSFLRVDVPDAEGNTQFTRYLGNGAIYSMTPVTEEVARRVGNGSAQPPVKPWEMPRALPPASSETSEFREPRASDYGGDDDSEFEDDEV